MTIQDALERFARLDLASWMGLPADCTIERLNALFDLEGAAFGKTVIGTRYHGVMFKPLPIASASGPLFVWYHRARLFRIVADVPPTDVEPLLERLGEPTAKLDCYFGNLQVRGGEWVYPERGLTLFLNPEQTNVVRAAAYYPTTLAAYEADLHYVEPPREFPAT